MKIKPSVKTNTITVPQVKQVNDWTHDLLISSLGIIVVLYSSELLSDLKKDQKDYTTHSVTLTKLFIQGVVVINTV